MWLGAWFAAGGCGESAPGSDSGAPVGSGSAAEVDCGALTWEGVGEPFVGAWCLSCHSAGSEERSGAPLEVNLDTEAEVRSWRSRIEVRAIELRTMPPTGEVPSDELATFADWLGCP